MKPQEYGIEFEKITDANVRVYRHGLKIGTIEIYKFSKYYVLEIMYNRKKVMFSQKKYIPAVIVGMHNGSLKAERMIYNQPRLIATDFTKMTIKE